MEKMYGVLSGPMQQMMKQLMFLALMDKVASLIKLSDKHKSLFNTSLYMQKEPAECVLMGCGRQPKSWSVTALALLKL